MSPHPEADDHVQHALIEAVKKNCADRQGEQPFRAVEEIPRPEDERGEHGQHGCRAQSIHLPQLQQQRIASPEQAHSEETKITQQHIARAGGCRCERDQCEAAQNNPDPQPAPPAGIRPENEPAPHRADHRDGAGADGRAVRGRRERKPLHHQERHRQTGGEGEDQPPAPADAGTIPQATGLQKQWKKQDGRHAEAQGRHVEDGEAVQHRMARDGEVGAVDRHGTEHRQGREGARAEGHGAQARAFSAARPA